MKDLPPPILELTFEQQFEMTKLLKSIEAADRDVIITACREILRHNFILKSTLNNLLHHWHDYEFGADDEGAEPS